MNFVISDVAAPLFLGVILFNFDILTKEKENYISKFVSEGGEGDNLRLSYNNIIAKMNLNNFRIMEITKALSYMQSNSSEFIEKTKFEEKDNQINRYILNNYENNYEYLSKYNEIKKDEFNIL